MSMTWDFILRLFVAGALGTVIGLDREYRAKEAGYRTHFLVSLGSALIMIVSQYGFMEVVKMEGIDLDPSRVAAQVVSGIGFIGAGTIIFQKQIVRGLTTAAGIWATSGIGLAIGAGMYWLGISATILTLIGLEALSYLFKSIGMKSSMVEFSTDNKETLNRMAKKFNSKEYNIVSYQLDEKRLGEVTTYYVTMVIKSKKYNDEVNKEAVPLRPAMELIAHVTYVKWIEKGTEVSYGGTFVAPKRMQIATIPTGYGDGYPRSLSNKGYVLIHGQKAPILGRVCMDQFMVDVTGIPDVKFGDRATLVGHDGDAYLSIDELANLSGRFNYEFICDINKRVPREYLRDGKVVEQVDYF